MSKKKKYHVALVFTRNDQHELISGVWTGDVARRIIQNELALQPSTDNGDTDIRYDTDDAEIFASLMVIAHQHANGGWFCIEPMPKDCTVYHFSSFGGKKDD